MTRISTRPRAFWDYKKERNMEGALKGALLFAQSGGPTAVINASAAGGFNEALDT